MRLTVVIAMAFLLSGCASTPATSPYANEIARLKGNLTSYQANLAAAETIPEVEKWKALCEQAALELENASRACEIDRALRMQYEPSFGAGPDLTRWIFFQSDKKKVEQIECR